jgi:hypothetical protein
MAVDQLRYLRVGVPGGHLPALPDHEVIIRGHRTSFSWLAAHDANSARPSAVAVPAGAV